MDTLARYVFDVNTPESWRYRSIENRCHLQRIAQSTQQIAQVQTISLAMQAEAASENHRQLAEMGFGIDCMNEGISYLQDQMAGVGQGISELNDTALRTESALYSIGDLLGEWLSAISQQMALEQKTMESIADTLRRPLETEALEIRKHADHAMTSGMAGDGQNRREWYADAMELFRKAVDNPIGKQDYVAWFQIGLLLWKADDNLTEAEQAFSRSARLSAPSRDYYHVESLCHLAYMRYLQGNHDGAHEAIQDAMQVSGACEVLFDGARYSAVTSRYDDAIKLLEECILNEPPMIVKMLAETDFDSMPEQVSNLVNKLHSEVHSRVTAILGDWHTALHLLNDLETTADCRIEITDDLDSLALEAAERLAGSGDYLILLHLESKHQLVAKHVIGFVRKRLKAELDERQSVVEGLRARQDANKKEFQVKKEQARRERRSLLESAMEKTWATILRSRFFWYGIVLFIGGMALGIVLRGLDPYSSVVNWSTWPVACRMVSGVSLVVALSCLAVSLAMIPIFYLRLRIGINQEYDRSESEYDREYASETANLRVLLNTVQKSHGRVGEALRRAGPEEQGD